jgi:hypothetical protein
MQLELSYIHLKSSSVEKKTKIVQLNSTHCFFVSFFLYVENVVWGFLYIHFYILFLIFINKQ